METATATAPTSAPSEGAAPPQAAGHGAQPGDMKAAAAQAAAAEAARKLKVRFDDGKEEEVAEDEVLRIYKERKKHQAVASKELNEGKMLRKQAEEFVNMLKDEGKFWEVARKLGHDPRSMSEKALSKILEDELMDPKEKELREMKSKLETYEKQQKEAEEAKKREEREALANRFMKEYEASFIQAMEKADIPKTKETVADMAKYVHRAAKIGYKLTADEAAKLVQQDIETSAYPRIRKLEGEALIKALGEETLAKIRKYDTARLKNPDAVLQTPAEQARREKTPPKRLTSREWQLKKRGLI